MTIDDITNEDLLEDILPAAWTLVDYNEEPWKWGRTLVFVISDGQEFYRASINVHVSEGAMDLDDLADFERVIPVERTVIKYKRVK